ncbi:hypothetical protein [Kitasatospora phosalacinea]|nr:hypothetical protein [Kitasatospora phosalacinea]
MANGLLEIRYMAENGRVFQGVENLDPDEPSDNDPISRIAMISDICHSFPGALAEHRSHQRERVAAEAMKWRWKCSGTSARRWIRARLTDCDKDYRNEMYKIGIDLDGIGQG